MKRDIGMGKAIMFQISKEIKDKILGGWIYGVLVIEEDVDAMIVAAYMLGKSHILGKQKTNELSRM